MLDEQALRFVVGVNTRGIERRDAAGIAEKKNDVARSRLGVKALARQPAKPRANKRKEGIGR